MIKKEKESEKVLLAYRSGPLSCGFSPAELLMRRKIRTFVPTLDTLLDPKWPDLRKLQETENARKLKQAQYFDKRHRVKSLSRLDPGTEVQVSTYPEPGVIL